MKINKDDDLLKLARYLHNEKIKLKKENRVLEKEVYILKSIIKEAREYIESFKKAFEGHYPFVDIRELDLNKLLEILDKVEENK